MTKTWSLAIAGLAVGLLIGAAIRAPILSPLPNEILSIINSLCTTALTVLGAYWLWRHQVKKRQQEIVPLAIEIFEPLYLQLALIATHMTPEGSAKAWAAVHDDEEPDISSYSFKKYRGDSLRIAVQEAGNAAVIAAEQWSSIQDVFLAARPEQLKHLTGLDTITRHVLTNAAEYLAYVTPQGTQKARGLHQQEQMVISWAAGKAGTDLNALDGRNRATFNYTEVDRLRTRLVEAIRQPASGISPR